MSQICATVAFSSFLRDGLAPSIAVVLCNLPCRSLFCSVRTIGLFFFVHQVGVRRETISAVMFGRESYLSGELEVVRLVMNIPRVESGYSILGRY